LGAMSLGLALVSRLRWGLVCRQVGRRWFRTVPYKNIRQVTHTPCTCPHPPTHNTLSGGPANARQAVHTQLLPTHSPTFGTSALDLHGLGLSVGVDTSARLMPSPHKARQVSKSWRSSGSEFDAIIPRCRMSAHL